MPQRSPTTADDDRSLGDAIDVHGHYGDYTRPGLPELECEFRTANARVVAERAARVGIRWTVVSPLAGLLPRGEADAWTANQQDALDVRQAPGLLQWAILNPLQPDTYAQVADLLTHPTCVGIKVHPEEHRYAIREHGEEVFAFAAEHRAVVLAHSGDPYSEPSDFVPFADRHPEMSLILAHLGNGGGASGSPDKQVRAIQASRHGNLYTDTSSAQSLLPQLIEWAVGEIGTDRILFGSDTPLYLTALQRARIESADIPTEAKVCILRTNAQRLLDLPQLVDAKQPLPPHP